MESHRLGVVELREYRRSTDITGGAASPRDGDYVEARKDLQGIQGSQRVCVRGGDAPVDPHSGDEAQASQGIIIMHIPTCRMAWLKQSTTKREPSEGRNASPRGILNEATEEEPSTKP